MYNLDFESLAKQIINSSHLHKYFFIPIFNSATFCTLGQFFMHTKEIYSIILKVKIKVID